MKKTACTILAAALMMQGLTGCGVKTSDVNVNSATTEEETSGTTLEAEDNDYDEADGNTGETMAGEAAADEAPAEETEKVYEESMRESTGAEKETLNSTQSSMKDMCYPEEPYDGLAGETYKETEEKGFASVAEEPLSTFAADVDTASYANLRRMIMDGYGVYDIPQGAVRIEEMLNYFDYDFATPKKGEPFAVTAEMNTCPWNKEHYLMMVGMKTEEIDMSEAPASNLVFLIDVSGSMYDEDKLPLLQKSFCMLAENLTANDRVSIVTYAGSDEVVLQGAKGNEYGKISKALNGLTADGCTNGGEGIKTAYKLAEENFIKGGNNRVILATDGDLNVGITTESGLQDLIEEKKESGVFLSVLGFGEGNINDMNMEVLADKGNGNYSYIDSIFEANKVLVKELGATLFTVAKDVKLQVEFNPALVKSYRLIGYDNRRMAAEDFHDDTKDGGEIGAGHCVTALYEVVLTGGSGQKLRYQSEEKAESKTESKYDNEYCAVSIRYKEPDGDTSKLLTYPVDTRIKSAGPSDDFLFAASVAEAGMVLADSEYKGDSSLDEVYGRLEDMNLKDESKKEFVSLVENLIR